MYPVDHLEAQFLTPRLKIKADVKGVKKLSFRRHISECFEVMANGLFYLNAKDEPERIDNLNYAQF